MTVRDIFEFLNGLYPVNTACDFDNVGILVGDSDTEVKKALVTLDCTLSAVKKAVDESCQLIITHHPVIFSPIKSVVKGSIPYELIKNGISVISMHTNLDMGDGGVNDCLCSALELKNITPVIVEDGYILKGGEVEPVSADCFAKKIKTALGGTVKYADGKKPIEKVLVCSGSGGDFIEAALEKGYDALVTADIKHHQFLNATDNGVSIFDAGHFETEDIVINSLKNILSEQFSETEFSAFHNSYIKYV